MTQAAFRPLRPHNDTSGPKATKTRVALRLHNDTSDLNITYGDNDIHTGYGTVWWLVCGVTVS